MARKKRELDPWMFNHVVMPGNNRQDIFKNETDVEKLREFA